MGGLSEPHGEFGDLVNSEIAPDESFNNTLLQYWKLGLKIIYMFF